MLIFSVDDLTDVLPCGAGRLDFFAHESLCYECHNLSGKVIGICGEILIMQITVVRLLLY